MPVKIQDTEAAVKLKEAMPVLRSGGETHPFEYPHLYRIQAGDWRISYAVEHNRLAILVLEVLNPDGSVRKDPEADTVQQKMKIKLLDWPEGSPSRDLPPEELGKKFKIKFLDLADELKPPRPQGTRAGRGIKLAPQAAGSSKERRITVVDATSRPAPAQAGDDDPNPGAEGEGKLTPLDGPTM